MIAELAAANAAFAVLKTTIQNGKEIASAGRALGQFLSAKEDIEREATKQRARGNTGSDLECFLALEKIKEQEKALKEMMIYAGRPGMWKDYQKFVAEAKDGRAEAKKIAARKAAALREKIGLGLVGLFLAGCLAGMIYLMVFLKGKL